MAYESTLIEASSAKTATGQGAAQGAPIGSKLAIALDVTAVTGTTPNMTVSVQWSHDGTAWFDGDPADAFTAITAAAKKVKMFDQKAPLYRLSWVITGTTPSFTFSARSYVVAA